MTTPELGNLIVALVNEKASLSLTFRKFSPECTAVLADDKRGRLHAIPFNGSVDTGFFIRSLITATRRHGAVAWLSNGQATRGVQLRHWAEGELTAYPTLEMIQNDWKQKYGDNWKQRQEQLHASGQTYIMALPHYLREVTTV